MLVAEICWRTRNQILSHSYFTKTLRIEGNYIRTTSVELEKWVATEEQKIIKEYGFDNIIELKTNRYY